jgi:hypothetical protein
MDGFILKYNMIYIIDNDIRPPGAYHCCACASTVVLHADLMIADKTAEQYKANKLRGL